MRGLMEGRNERSKPTVFADATLQLSPVKARAMRTPILIDAPSLSVTARTVKTLSTGCVPHYRVTSLTPCLISCP